MHGRERDTAVETARIYELLGRMYFYSNETLPIMYAILKFLNSTEKAGTSPELATAYSGMAVLAGLAGLHKLAETYVDRAITVAHEVNQPSNIITVSVVTGVYQVSVGKWDIVRSRTEEAQAICEQLGDYRQWNDCAALLSESAFLSGDLPYALRMHPLMLEDARRRGSPMPKRVGVVWGCGEQHPAGNGCGSPFPCSRRRCDSRSRSRMWLPNSIRTRNSPSPIITWAIGRRLSSCRKGIDPCGGDILTVYSLDVGFSAVAQVYFELWEEALRSPGGTLDPAAMKAGAERAIKLLRRFAGTFPIGKPFAMYYQGWYEALTGKHQAAVHTWRRGLEAALKYNLLYEEGLLRLKLGTSGAGRNTSHARSTFSPPWTLCVNCNAHARPGQPQCRYSAPVVNKGGISQTHPLERTGSTMN